MRCTSPQLGSLNALLIAALLHCEREDFEKLIDLKLSFPSMNIAQRVYWLAAGFFASPVIVPRNARNVGISPRATNPASGRIFDHIPRSISMVNVVRPLRRSGVGIVDSTARGVLQTHFLLQAGDVVRRHSGDDHGPYHRTHQPTCFPSITGCDTSA